MVLMHKNSNIIFTVVGIGVIVVLAGTLLTLGNIVTTVNLARPVLAQKRQEQQNQNENVVLPAAANMIATTSSASESEPIPPIIINDSNLKAEVVFRGIEFPTSMAFLGPDDILVLEKNNGTVRRIVDGIMLPEPLLDVNVANKNERGMLGIAVAKHHKGPTYVFLYYTEASRGVEGKGGDGTDDCPTATLCNKENNPLGNRLYRYELVDNKLVNPKLLLDLPATPGPSHNGGKIVIGPANDDNNLYVVIGEVTLTATQASNRQKGLAPDGRGGILRITQDGQAVGEEKGVGVLGNSSSVHGNLSKLNLYYAYGIRNSFGMDFDPVTGNLWDSENGPSYGDEINLVYPGFNSGWRKVQGIWEVKGDFRGNIVSDTTDDNNKNNNSSTSSLEGFGGKGRYNVPKFVWNNPVAPTAVKFLSSNKLGAQYQNDLFVGDANNGNIYHFDLNNNKNRTELVLKGHLTDKVADNISENKDIIWAKGFRIVTDMQVGPYDGYLYVLSLNLPHDRGTIYRIVPRGE
jgi:glucose/arabinose dehydrogenase